MSHEKMADLFHFHYLGSLYSQNWENLNLKVNELLIFFDKKMISDLIMSCQTVSDLI